MIQKLLLITVLFTLPETKIPKCHKLPNGRYLVHSSRKYIKDYEIAFRDTFFIKYGPIGDPFKINITWLGACMFRMDDPNLKYNSSDTGSLKIIHDSFGDPCNIELGVESGDTTYFRQTFTGNLHISVDEGYFLRLRK